MPPIDLTEPTKTLTTSLGDTYRAWPEPGDTTYDEPGCVWVVAPHSSRLTPTEALTLADLLRAAAAAAGSSLIGIPGQAQSA